MLSSSTWKSSLSTLITFSFAALSAHLQLLTKVWDRTPHYCPAAFFSSRLRGVKIPSNGWANFKIHQDRNENQSRVNWEPQEAKWWLDLSNAVIIPVEVDLRTTSSHWLCIWFTQFIVQYIVSRHGLKIINPVGGCFTIKNDGFLAAITLSRSHRSDLSCHCLPLPATAQLERHEVLRSAFSLEDPTNPTRKALGRMVLRGDAAYDVLLQMCSYS